VALFVTGTGTGVGKTHVSCGILRARGGHGVKPVMSGFDPAEAGTSDAGLLLRAMGEAVTADSIAAVSPWRFAAPLSPDMAAAREGRVVPFAELLGFCRQPGIDLVEGVGGVAVPLDATHTVLDWMAELGFPALLVAGSYLGTLSHTLTALMALQVRGIEVEGVVVNETPGSTVDLAETIASLRQHAAVPVSGLRRGESFGAFGGRA
jgi:dethiobiotin synthetase